ncbi:hypothetical protein PT015_21875 [Candidatus Mycobacterium wuenschmannii]|uniref:Uncharacterized protein n=1 Tax=Candidatus Mycobacterium wuenschmannii TaxID=3027808 RepID=A0ABY8VZ36_9MYCO|nr:hypothetical protein [Candidatus Mycobacterium wuenschmannii]WIM87457.1 hypothetical protein PT015_21875 [Candidatus Mycobacterium wuenschmannii]
MNFNGFVDAQQALRADILDVGDVHFVSMADIQACPFDGKLGDLSAEHQQLVADTVRSLFADGLVETLDPSKLRR